MPKFSALSQSRLATCEGDLQRLFNEVIKHFDCTIACGFRSKEDQDEAVRLGRSKTSWPTSKHNKSPSRAVDAYPYPVDFSKGNDQRLFAGFVLGVASQMGIKIRWGGDWDSDGTTYDQTFNDMPHFELVD